MAYMKYKELTKYFNFKKEIDSENLPKYVMQYISEDEKVLRAYKTRRDKGIFTDKRAILFDLKWFGTVKTIHVIPYHSVSTAAIAFNRNKASWIFSMNSGYPLKLNFVNMDSGAKMRLRKLYVEVINEHILK